MGTTIPGERLRVFISSSQNNEDGFAWSSIRKRIKEYLQECPYLNPFIIEDVCSVTPSTQLYQRQVERSDIFVLLVKGELRKGTAIEYTLATTLNKPMLVYFLDDDTQNSDVTKLKAELEQSDYSTHHTFCHHVSDIEEIEKNVFNDIMQDVIRCFQDKYYSYNYDAITNKIKVLEENEISKISAPSKEIIAIFDGCYDFLFEKIGIESETIENKGKKSEFEDFGSKMINWLLYGTPLNSNEEVLSLIDKCDAIYSNTDWLRKRWDAIIYQMNGNVEDAYKLEKEALEIAKNSKMPKWIIDDILIDCRNINAELHKIKGEILICGEEQNELNQSKTIVYLPVLDRYLGLIYENIRKDEFRIDTASRHTILFGSNISNAVKHLENYYFSAILYGSYTHLLVTRKMLAYTLNKYAEMTENTRWSFETVKLYILQGNMSEFKLYLREKWDEIYSYIGTYADKMFVLSENVPIVSRDAMKLAVIETVGLYFSEKLFSKAEQFLFKIGSTIDASLSVDYFDCIIKNVSRLDQNKIVETVTKIISEKRFTLGSKITSCLWYLDIDNVLEENLILLKKALVEKWTVIVKNNGDPQVISKLVKCNKRIFGDLESLKDNGLTGVQEKLYKINVGSNDLKPLLIEELSSAKRRFVDNIKEGCYKLFAHDPYQMISIISRNVYDTWDSDIIEILKKEFIPFSVEVLNSKCDLPIKDACAACLCDILSLFVKKNVEISDDIIDSLKDIDVSKDAEFSIIGSKNTLSIRLFMIKFIVGLIGKDKLYLLCVEYNRKSTNERYVLADCLETYLYYNKEECENVDSIIMTIVTQCFEDENYEIRCTACKMLFLLLNSQNEEVVKNLLYQAAIDPSHFVRKQLLNLCNESNNMNDIIKILTKDANFAIRNHAIHIMP